MLHDVIPEFLQSVPSLPCNVCVSVTSYHWLYQCVIDTAVSQSGCGASDCERQGPGTLIRLTRTERGNVYRIIHYSLAYRPMPEQLPYGLMNNFQPAFMFTFIAITSAKKVMFYHTCVCLFFVCLSSCLSYSNFAFKNYWLHLHENFTRYVSVDTKNNLYILEFIRAWIGI